MEATGPTGSESRANDEQFTAAPQLSSDGNWWWDGQKWVALHSGQARTSVPRVRAQRIIFAVLAVISFVSLDLSTQYLVDVVRGREVDAAMAAFFMLAALGLIPAVALLILVFVPWMRRAVRGRLDSSSSLTNRVIWFMGGLVVLGILGSVKSLFEPGDGLRVGLYGLVSFPPALLLVGASWMLLILDKRLGKDLARVAFIAVPIVIAFLNPLAGVIGLGLMIWGLVSLRSLKDAAHPELTARIS